MAKQREGPLLGKQGASDKGFLDKGALCRHQEDLAGGQLCLQAQEAFESIFPLLFFFEQISNGKAEGLGLGIAFPRFPELDGNQSQHPYLGTTPSISTKDQHQGPTWLNTHGWRSKKSTWGWGGAEPTGASSS